MKYRNSGNRPWWWIVNPWLYAMRRDHAYEEILDSLREESVSNYDNLKRLQNALIKANTELQKLANMIEERNKHE